jgi:epoxyqueuosine reductase
MKLLESIELIKEKQGMPVQSKVLSNYTSIPEKVLFRYSGLADLGKNGVLINRNMGSFFSIGEAFIDLEMDFENELYLHTPDFSLCGTCEICKAACPTTAIIEDGIINVNRCFQYLSETLVLMPQQLREKWGNRLYGCTTCLDVCPYNKTLDPRAEKHNIGFIGTGMDLIEALNMPQKKWMQTFSNNQLGIRDRRAILKNAILAIGCMKYKKALDFLYPYLNHKNDIIRAYTAWSIGMFHSSNGMKKLYTRYKIEECPLVKSEIEYFL